MEKMQRFVVEYWTPPLTIIYFDTVEARSIADAKNRIMAQHPFAQIKAVMLHPAEEESQIKVVR
ncbi:MAG TPA: hypothetical protein VD902_08510 [Symbiobacteriaceae bacterium]|nr:hypothetical protein [Symbiobacteriaceae bacterium]